MRRWRIGLALLPLVVVLWVLLTRFGTVLASHPAYLVVLAVVGLLALLALITGLRATETRRQRPRWMSVLSRVAQVVGVLLVSVGVGLLRPYAASEPAVAATERGTDGVRVTSSATMIVLEPVGRPVDAGLVFLPGALVDPRAYVPLLSQVAQAGYQVHIVKPPLGIAFLAGSAADVPIDNSPDMPAWATGGHSLGGVVAASYALDHPDEVAGLLLWASYPSGSLAEARLEVISVSGTADAITTPADVRASQPNLPTDTTFVGVEGSVHAFFGDYGTQRGDGQPTVDREEAQAQIVNASLDFMAAVAAR